MKQKQMPQGHQTLLGVANVAGNMIQFVFALFLIGLVITIIGSIF